MFEEGDDISFAPNAAPRITGNAIKSSANAQIPLFIKRASYLKGLRQKAEAEKQPEQ
jgi:hypothetical protein